MADTTGRDPRPDPPYPADTYVGNYHFEIRDPQRMVDSDTWAALTDRERAYWVQLFFMAWVKGRPTGSLRNDDRWIARVIGMYPSWFARIRDKLLRGWVECSDGRLYHPEVCKNVQAAANRRKNWQESSSAYRLRKQALRENVSDDVSMSHHKTKTKTSTTTSRKVSSKSESVALPEKPVSADNSGNRLNSKETHGTRLPEKWHPDAETWDWAKNERPDLIIPKVIEEFRDYWRAQPGQRGRKADWTATFRNWVRRQKAPREGEKPPQSAADRKGYV